MSVRSNSLVTPRFPLAAALWPEKSDPVSGIVRGVVLIALGSALLTLSAKINLPLPYVPMTLQTLVVLMIGAAYGWRLGVATVIAYLAEGAMGMPVFAGGVAGAQVFAGPTAGYLIAFPLAAALTGWLAERAWDRRFLTMLGVMLLGSGVIFAIGAAGLTRFVPASQVLAAGVLPFLPGDLFKTSLAALLIPRVWRWVSPGRGTV